MNSGIFTPKIVYKCEENYRNKKKEYIDAIKKYKYLINELQQWQKTYKHNMKIYKSGPVNFKVNDIDFIDTAQIKSIVYNNPELIKEGLIYKSGLLDKFKNFAKQSEPVVQECNPKYITELTELEKRYKYLKETYETMYAETKKLQEESKKAAEEWRNKKEIKSSNNNDNNNDNYKNKNNNNDNFRNNNNNFKNNNDNDFDF